MLVRLLLAVSIRNRNGENAVKSQRKILIFRQSQDSVGRSPKRSVITELNLTVPHPTVLHW